MIENKIATSSVEVPRVALSISFVLTEITFTNNLLITGSAEYLEAVALVETYFVSYESVFIETISFTTTDLVSTTCSVVISITSTESVETVITEVIVNFLQVDFYFLGLDDFGNLYHH